MPDTLAETYAKMLNDFITSDECYPMPAILRGDQLHICAFCGSPDDMLAHICDECTGDHSIVEALFGVDCYTQPDQGTTLGSVVVVFHIRQGEPSRIGVLEYAPQERKPIAWDNAFWNTAYNDLAARFAGWLMHDAG